MKGLVYCDERDCENTKEVDSDKGNINWKCNHHTKLNNTGGKKSGK